MHEFVNLIIIWVSVLFANWLARKTRLTSVLWLLAFGCVLVNVGLLPVKTGEFIHGFSELGIIVIMFALGFEESTDNFMVSIKRSWGIALFGALAPFLAAYSLTYYFWGSTTVSILCGLTMTATAVSLTMVTLRSEKLHTSKAATGIMTSAVLDDIASLALLAIVIPMLSQGSSPGDANIPLLVGKVVIFFVLVTIVGAWIFPHRVKKGWVSRLPGLNNYGFRHIVRSSAGESTTLLVLITAVFFGLLAHWFGFHPAIGAYMAGLILREEYFDLDDSTSGALYKRTQSIIDDIAYNWIGPVFFVVLGTKLVFDSDIVFTVLDDAILLYVAVFLSQIFSASAAARYTGRFPWHDSWMIGFGMVGRAELAFVVMNIAFVQQKLISIEVFYTLMLTCFLLNVTVPLAIRWWTPHYQKAQERLGESGSVD